MTLDEQERFIIAQIQFLQHAYQKAAQPWIQRLTNLRAYRPGHTIVIDGEFLESRKIIPEGHP